MQLVTPSNSLENGTDRALCWVLIKSHVPETNILWIGILNRDTLYFVLDLGPYKQWPFGIQNIAH